MHIFELQMWHWPRCLLSTCEVLMTELYCRYCHDHLEMSDCKVAVIKSVSPLLVMKLVFGMPWCSLWRFMPRNFVMCSMGTLGCFFQITFKLIGLHILRSISNLHYQGLAVRGPPISNSTHPTLVMAVQLQLRTCNSSCGWATLTP